MGNQLFIKCLNCDIIRCVWYSKAASALKDAGGGWIGVRLLQRRQCIHKGWDEQTVGSLGYGELVCCTRHEQYDACIVEEFPVNF